MNRGIALDDKPFLAFGRKDSCREHSVAVIYKDFNGASVDKEAQMRQSLRQRTRALFAVLNVETTCKSRTVHRNLLCVIVIRNSQSARAVLFCEQLQRQVFIYNRIKAGNDEIYDNVDAIHTAIHDNLQILFKYCEWTIKKELVRKKSGADYIVSPWALTWDDENYYLVGYEESSDMIKHYRVDKMQEIRITGQPRLGRERFEKFDLAAFARKTFGMFGGEDREITLEAENHLVGVLIDRFGTDIIMAPHGEDHFRTSVTVAVSPQFFGWLAGIGKGIRISWPESVREQYRSYLRDIAENT